MAPFPPRGHPSVSLWAAWMRTIRTCVLAVHSKCLNSINFKRKTSARLSSSWLRLLGAEKPHKSSLPCMYLRRQPGLWQWWWRSRRRRSGWLSKIIWMRSRVVLYHVILRCSLGTWTAGEALLNAPAPPLWPTPPRAGPFCMQEAGVYARLECLW